MTAPLLNSFAQLGVASSTVARQYLGGQPSDPMTEEPAFRRGNSRHFAPDRPSDRLTASSDCDDAAIGISYKQLLELLPQGVILVSRTFKPIYWNQRAKDLCQQALEAPCSVGALPSPVMEACHRFLRQTQSTSQLLLEYRTQNDQVLRIRLRWLGIDLVHGQDVIPLPLPGVGAESATVLSQRTAIAIFLEHCEEVAQEEGRIQQQKYDLTDREAEIWMLLRKEYTYQEIAQILQISLNTVKTHVKNVYAKRRSCQGKEKFWYCEQHNSHV